MDIDEIKRSIKKRRSTCKKEKKIYSKSINKFLITIVLTLICLIVLKANTKLQSKFYHYIYEDTMKFTYFKGMYEKYFGSILPTNLKKEVTVFNEKLSYNNISSYGDGCKLEVDNNYLIPALNSGMVVYIGNKEKLGNTIIVQQIDGIDVWYGNVSTTSLKLYDYIEKGSLIGEAKDNNLYIVFKKDGQVLEYEKYL